MTAVALDPAPLNTMPAAGVIESTPQILIFYRLARGGAPAALFPVRHPDVDATHDISGIRRQHYTAAGFERFERGDGGHELHPVIGGQRFRPKQFFLPAAAAQQRTPSAYARIAAARAVGEYFD